MVPSGCLDLSGDPWEREREHARRFPAMEIKFPCVGASRNGQFQSEWVIVVVAKVKNKYMNINMNNMNRNRNRMKGCLRNEAV